MGELLTADDMRTIARDACARLGEEILALMLSKGMRGVERKEKTAINREIKMRKRWIALLRKVEQAETSSDAETGIDGLFITGAPYPMTASDGGGDG